MLSSTIFPLRFVASLHRSDDCSLRTKFPTVLALSPLLAVDNNGSCRLDKPRCAGAPACDDRGAHPARVAKLKCLLAQRRYVPQVPGWPGPEYGRRNRSPDCLQARSRVDNVSGSRPDWPLRHRPCSRARGNDSQWSTSPSARLLPTDPYKQKRAAEPPLHSPLTGGLLPEKSSHNK